ncbi:MAG TPA: phosphoenolpyruvate carboxylase [Candidatus Gracilibacteria bacterium]|nr:phosphoenolpyruvate carboxylase [Candidatus Gracilibacteria bacterium]
MATQHPDNACPVYFLGERFIHAKDEIEECYRCFKELGVEEYMWDWEGKFVDEAVIDRLYTEYHDYFKKVQLGRDKFLTFRLPNIWIESSHKLPRAFMNILSAEKAAKTYGFHSPPLFEVILPMTTSDVQLIYLQKTFKKIARVTEDIFETKTDVKMIDVIPLFEEFEVMHNCKDILEGYTRFLEKEYKFKPDYMRVFTARSDTAMNGGFLPAKLAVKLAISHYHDFGKENGIEMYPWVGGGCLPFRGGINPENIEPAIDEYRGVASLTVQSAFRYDYDLDTVKKAIKTLNTEIPKNRASYVKASKSEAQAIMAFNREAQKLYKPTVEAAADIINEVAGKLPSHRERVQHVGLFGYSRGIGKVKLPRAIKFTGSLYSLGIPPELIGSGRALKRAKELGILKMIEKFCPYIREDFKHAGHYLNRENLDHLAKKYPAFKILHKDINEIENILNIQIGPEKPHHFIHRNLASNIYHKLHLNEDFSDDALSAAEIRKSLG